ncbi:MAG: sensor histidine kinase [Planctomycetota bacterium]|jgi:signal transduction histidine kinase
MKPVDTDKQRKEVASVEQIFDLTDEQIQGYCASGKSVMDLAHLVKNMIQMVSGSVEIMELSMERKQYDRIRRSWEIFGPNFVRLKKFVLDLIKYTKHYPLQFDECDFNKLVQKGIKSCEYILKNKHVKIQLHQDTKIPTATIDAGKIEELVMNLITHALDNLPEHMGMISIQTLYLSECRQIQLTVSDDGPSLSEEARRQLSEPFERTRNMCGTGFDIPLATLYASQHDGYMEIDADAEQGNHVTVYLPVK